MASDWERVGSITVDAGLCWIGDPCYVLDPEERRPTDLGSDWEEFCDRLHGRQRKNAAQWNHESGVTGLGVTVGTGYGDGIYPVLVRRNPEGLIVAVMVNFEGDDDEI